MTRSNSNSTKAKIKLSNRTQNEAATKGYTKEKMDNARRSLLESGTYMGATNTEKRTKLKWEHVGNADYAVVDEEGKAGTSKESDEGNVDVQGPTPAVLTAVVQIAEEDYWLTACGMWKEPTDVTASLAEVKLSCMGIVPKHETFAQDFPNVLKNLQNIRNSKKSPGCEKQVGMLNKERVKFRHVLFEVSDVRGSARSRKPAEAEPAEAGPTWALSTALSGSWPRLES
ncbi:hypothetical protein M378DRAFT_12543 [Amanita muscaria Koide BX008]|uniref:Uncharacterized protein n=1 Tax=Amanita muscaria (strain Koide BX008) TaxID=946122 RepID=A0A0C2X191_AMAMK|nr:hypothetical protein M378DRAFT_12543 [Amanita muscaria Koide BX008]